MNMAELRKEYPQYNDLSDTDFADKFHKKFYSDMPKEEFNAKINLKPSPVPEQAEAHWYTPNPDKYGWHDQYGLGDEIINSMSFGLGPRVSAAGMTAADVFGDVVSGKGMPDISDTYDKRLGQRFEQRDKYRKEHPYRSTIGGIVGAFGSPFAKPVDAWMRGGKFFGTQTPKLTKLGTPKPVGYTKPIKQAYPKVPSVGRSGKWEAKPWKVPLKDQMGKGAITGAGFAGTQAFNEAEGDLMDRAVAGSKGGGIGATLGGGLPPLIKGGAWALQQLAGAISKIPNVVETVGRGPMAEGMQETLAWRKLAEALERDGYTLESAAKRLDELGPEAVIADLGDNTRSLAYSVYSKPSKGLTMVFNKAESRQKGVFPDDDPAGTLQGGQRNRINEKADELFPERFQGVQNADDASKAYQSAYANNQNIQSDAIDKIINSHNGRKAFKKAVEMMDDSGEFVGKSDPELVELWRLAEDVATPDGKGISSGLKLKTLDYFKRALQREEKQLIKNQDSEGARIINRQIKKVTSELDRLDATGGDYAKARKLTSIDFQNQEAFDLGQRFMRKDVRIDDLTKKLADMGAEQLHNYRIGAIRQLKNNIGDMTAGANKAQKILDDEALQRKVKEVFGDNNKFGEYLTLLKNEAEMTKLRTTLGGSKTAKNLGGNEDATIDPKAILGGLTKIAAKNWVGGTIDILRSLGNQAFMREKTANTLGKVLTSKDLSGITRKYTPKKATPQSRSNLASKLTIGASPLIGRKRKPDIVLRKSILDAR